MVNVPCFEFRGFCCCGGGKGCRDSCSGVMVFVNVAGAVALAGTVLLLVVIAERVWQEF
mgnify:CR=1 FL=1